MQLAEDIIEAERLAREESERELELAEMERKTDEFFARLWEKEQQAKNELSFAI